MVLHPFACVYHRQVEVRFSGDGMSVLHHYALQDRVADAGAFLDGPLGGTAALNAETARRESALYMAATAGHERFVAMLLAYATGDDEAGGLNVNATDASGKTALYAAAEHRHAHVARILANHGVDVNCATRKGNTGAGHREGERGWWWNVWLTFYFFLWSPFI